MTSAAIFLDETAHNLIPSDHRVVVEKLANPVFEVDRHDVLDPVEIRDGFFNDLANALAARKKPIRVFEAFLVRNDLLDAVLRDFVLDEPDKDVGRHGVQFDTLTVQQILNFSFGCAVDRQAIAQLFEIVPDLDSFRFETQALNIGKPQTEIDDFDFVLEPIASAVRSERLEN